METLFKGEIVDWLRVDGAASFAFSIKSMIFSKLKQ